MGENQFNSRQLHCLMAYMARAEQAGQETLRSNVQRAGKAGPLQRLPCSRPRAISADNTDSVAELSSAPRGTAGPAVAWNVAGLPVIGIVDRTEMCSGARLTSHVMTALTQVGLAVSTPD
ncbi:hypothetical protein BKG82_27260 [Mycobacteroides chelonae]|uniref:Uncharacterized protein n=1 Tax=Mycobacteroides chelonae TaxID=1774 RepID=A0A1S1LJ60_MYCCH|nr:hypothetical protein [Mycobacteroides chelonae]OHU47352.1 hypothetical protein BKG82_27260 [Mycobacteroides chelonae]